MICSQEWLLLLLCQKRIEQHGIQIFRDRGMITLRNGGHLRYGHDAVYDIQSVKGLRGSPDTIGFLLEPGRTDLGICVTHIGILQLLLVRHAVDIQHISSVFYLLMSQQPQIDGSHGLKHTHSAGSVPQAVVRFQRDPVPKIIDAHQITVICLEVHGLTGIFHILLHEGAGPVIGLQIPPEQPLSDRRLVGREPGQSQIQRLLQNIRLDLLLQHH